jgi:hypothetical protein
MLTLEIFRHGSEEGSRGSKPQLVKLVPIGTCTEASSASTRTRKFVRDTTPVRQRIQGPRNRFGTFHAQNGFIVVQQTRATMVQLGKGKSWTTLLSPGSRVEKRQYAFFN